MVGSRPAWRVVFTKQAQKGVRKLAGVGLRPRAEDLLQILTVNPFGRPPSFERLVGDLAGAFSRRITIQHRLIYQVLEKERAVKVLRMWTH